MSDDDLLPSTPRMARPRALHRRLRVVLPTALVIASTIAVVVGYDNAAELRHLVDEGVATSADVVDLRTSRSRRSTSYHVDYAFAVDGTAYRGSQSLPRHAWDRLAVGDPIAITYWSQGPATSRIGKVSPEFVDGAIRDGWTIAGLVAALVGIVVWIIERKVRRFVGLMRDGRAVIGRVVDYVPARHRKQRSRIAYEFRSPAGGTTRGEDRLERKLDPPPEVDSEIVVLQSREQPTRFACLPRVLEVAELET